LCAALLGLVAGVSPAQQSTSANQVTLDSSETLFTVLTAINACGYDTELDISDPLRSQIRDEVNKNIDASEDLKNSVGVLCQYYQARLQVDTARNLAQFVSLALYLNPPPALTLKVKEADLAPDAVPVLGFLPMLQKFYADAGLHAIWHKHQAAYAAFNEHYHVPLAKMLFDTEIYLKVPSSGYLGRGFTVYLDPMGAPSQTNARNYVSDYFVVITPGKVPSLKMEQIRHTYLHYLLDPLAMKYPDATKRLGPLLESLKSAPMDETFKDDPAILATECLIRAIEARTSGPSNTPEAQRQAAVEASMKQGFVLTQYFYDALLPFEKGDAGLRNVYGNMLIAIDVRKEERLAASIKFAPSADPEVLHLARSPLEGKLLSTAEQKLASGDVVAAQKLAQQALDEKSEDPGRAMFILAQVAVKNKDMEGARNYFEKTLTVAHEPKLIVWSHIYLGRIFDLQEERDAALDHYRAALNAGEQLPEAKAAAQAGLQQPYEPPSHPE
jgi:tetratricopeptide (TPR) repeat protein